MTTIATTSPSAEPSTPFVASNDVHVPAGRSSRGSRSSSIDSVATQPVGSLLTPRQKMMADMESLIGVFLQIFIASRTAAREHNLYLRESIARMVELEAEKMMSAALMQLVGGVIQGSAGIVSGTVQIGGAVSALKSMRDGLKSIEPQMKQESLALKTLNDAKSRLVVAKPGAATEAAQGKLGAATASYDKAKAELTQVWDPLKESPGYKELYKSIDAHVAYWNGVASVIKGGGEVIESGFKYSAAGADKDRSLLDALKQYLQASQQSNQDFERDLSEMNRQLLEQLRTITDRSHQLNMNLGQAV